MLCAKGKNVRKEFRRASDNGDARTWVRLKFLLRIEIYLPPAQASLSVIYHFLSILRGESFKTLLHSTKSRCYGCYGHTTIGSIMAQATSIIINRPRSRHTA